MRSCQQTGWAVVFGIALTIVASACSGASPEGQRAHGIVRSVDAGARKVTLDHEDIPGLMKAMTMTFDVAPRVALEDLSPGDAVEFSVEEGGRAYTVTEMRRDEP